jgi:hypothetical protein
MPYQDTNNQDVTPDEYIRLLEIQRRVLQSQGGATPRMSQVDTSFPTQNQQPQMQLMPSQRMMLALQGMDYQGQGNSNRSQIQMLGNNTLHHSMSSNKIDFSYGHGNRGSGHQSNLSRSMYAGSLNSNQQFNQIQFNQVFNTSNGMGFGNNSGMGSRTLLSRSLNDTNNFEMSSSVPSRNSGGVMNNSFGQSSIFPSTNSNGGFFRGESMTNQGYRCSSPPKNLPTNDALPSYTKQNKDNTVDLTDELVAASAGLLSPVMQGKRRRLNSDDLVLQMLGATVSKNPIFHDDNVTNRSEAASCLSPFTRRTEACSPLTPLNQAQARGFADSDSPMGQTPLMFAKFFLEDENEIGAKKVAGIPLPPLYQSENERGLQQKSGGRKFSFTDPFADHEQIQDKPLATPFSSEPLCLPPRRKKKTSTPKSKKKVATKSSPKTPPKEKLKAADSPCVATGDRHPTTPSTACALPLSEEIQSSIWSPGSTDGSNASSSPRSAVVTQTQSKDGFSVPQFATSMEASQFSQQSIHDWDKKFGLRRAHSKTMRESARSRRNVLEFLKGDGSELLKSALATGLKQSTNTATTFTNSLSCTSFMSQESDVNGPDVDNAVDTVNGNSDDEKSHESNNQALHGTFHIPAKEGLDNDKMQDTGASSSTPGLCNDDDSEDDDKSMGFGSIASFSHQDQDEENDGLQEKEDNEKDSHEFHSSYSSKILEFDIEDEELTNMFRRASLDHMPENIRRSSTFHRRSSSVILPLLEESDRKELFARSA